MAIADLTLRARNAGAPLIFVQTTDQIAALADISATIPAETEIGDRKVAVVKLTWDVARGVVGVNPEGKKWLKSVTNPDDDSPAALTNNPQTGLEIADQMPPGGVFFMLNAHRFVADPFVSTALLNKREPFKATERSLVMLGPDAPLPIELQQDVMVLDDPLPDDVALAARVRKLTEGNGLKLVDDDVSRSVDAVRGLSLFATETAVAISMRKAGVDFESLWDRKRTQIGQTKGVTLLKGGPTLADIGGNDEIRRYGAKLMGGPERPRAIWIWDEVEKFFAGSSGANASSVDADYLGVGLREMEDNGHDGMILVSPPGCGKTLFAKALAATYGVPGVQFDFGAMKGRFVGDSETAVRTAFKVGNGIAAGRALILATCNRLDSLPPEFRRRFTNGIWYFDLPSKEERTAIWLIQQKAHGLPLVADITFDDGWTGAEIRNCCRIAKRLDVPLAEAAGYVVPVSVADPSSIAALRKLATDRFLSANYPGRYTNERPALSDVRKVRAVES